ncbi:MAG TPA: hypothetical protein VE153_40535, partial [Myxococcus sp.]|nr:hypothetical protein [Myxococcus sp.]
MPAGEDLMMDHGRQHSRQRFPLFLSGLLLTLGASPPVHAQAPTPPMTPPAAVTIPAPQALASAWEEVRSK